MTIGGYELRPLLRKTFKEIWSDNIMGLSAQAAYSFFFSLFPILLFLAPLFSLVGNKQEVLTRILARISATLPPEAYDLLRNVVKDVVFSKNAPGLVSIGIILAAFSGSSVVSTMMGALNAAYGVRDPRPFWKTRLIALAFTVAAVVVVGVATGVMLAGPTIVGFMADQTNLGPQAESVWKVIQYPIALTLLIGFLWLSYSFLPYVRHRAKLVLVGSVLATAAWMLMTLIFRLYVANFGSYNSTYGTIGGVVILLTWMYLTMFVVLSGGELIAELEANTGKAEKPEKADVATDRPESPKVKAATKRKPAKTSR